MIALPETPPVQSASDLVLGRLQEIQDRLDPSREAVLAATISWLVEFVKAEAACLDAGKPDTQSSDRIYRAMHGICNRLGLSLKDTTSGIQVVSFVVSRLRSVLKELDMPVYRTWLGNLSSTDLLVYITRSHALGQW